MLGITHRDIKPSNMVFGKDGEVRLVDFGLAKDSKHSLKGKSGTPLYMAPEALKGKSTHKVDIWALGCVAYEMVAGKHPFKSETRSELDVKIVSSDYKLPSSFSPELGSLIKHMLNPDPKQRPTARELWKHAWFGKFIM